MFWIIEDGKWKLLTAEESEELLRKLYEEAL